jgi:hypothetical protein
MKMEQMLECLFASQESIKTSHEEMMARLDLLAIQMMSLTKQWTRWSPP